LAQRPVYLPVLAGDTLVTSRQVEFVWHPGFAISQKRRNISALREAARSQGWSPLLEISSKSDAELGRCLSAFNLTLVSEQYGTLTVEAAFQGSKVFTVGGPHTDLFQLHGREIKRDERLKGHLVAFEFEGERWQLQPTTAFYDWLYIRALHGHAELRDAVLSYVGFTDIEFNPRRSLNCQARAAATYVALRNRGLIEPLLASRELYLAAVGGGQLRLRLEPH